jgi:nucleoside-diphosphate-sugar epimerase
MKLGSLFPIRDFTYVRDTVDGFIKAAEIDKSNGQTINLGNNNEISIGELVDKIIYLTGSKITLKTDEERIRPQKSEVERLRCDNKKAMEILGWSPTYDIDAGLKETIGWMELNKEYYKADIYITYRS